MTSRIDELYLLFCLLSDAEKRTVLFGGNCATMTNRVCFVFNKYYNLDDAEQTIFIRKAKEKFSQN